MEEQQQQTTDVNDSTTILESTRTKDGKQYAAVATIHEEDGNEDEEAEPLVDVLAHSTTSHQSHKEAQADSAPTIPVVESSSSTVEESDHQDGMV